MKSNVFYLLYILHKTKINKNNKFHNYKPTTPPTQRPSLYKEGKFCSEQYHNDHSRLYMGFR